MEEPETVDRDPGPTGQVRVGGETFALTREELRTTFEYQVRRLQEIDSKAIEILKANLLLIGLVVTGGSILVQTEINIVPFLNLFSVTGLLLLLASTALAGITYVTSNLRGGFGPEAVEAAIEARHGSDADAAAFEDRTLRSYARWIEYNARITAVNDMFATITVLLVIVSFLYVVAGLAAGMLAPPLPATVAAFALLSLLFGWLVRLVYHMDHLGPSDPAWDDTFDGVRLSKGVTREEGWIALLEMLGRAEDDEPGVDGQSHRDRRDRQ